MKDEDQYIKDYQEIKIQVCNCLYTQVLHLNILKLLFYILSKEQIGKGGLGAMPRSMWVSLEDDLVDKCKPGDDVIIWYDFIWSII